MNTQAFVNRIAVYKLGQGPEVFLMPYPHASSQRSSSEGRFAQLLVKNGFTVITFDPPGFGKSVCKLKGDLQEMFDAAHQCLNYFKINKPLIFAGHSMAGFCALAMQIEYPNTASAMILSGSPSGWPDVFRNSIHKKWKPFQKEFWQSRYWGGRIIINRANLRIHKKLDNLNSYHSFYNKSFFEEIPVEKNDSTKPAPPRAVWLRNVRNYDYSGRLTEVSVPVLITAGKFDPVIPPEVSAKMADTIPGAEFHLFLKSGHSPFIEEPSLYSKTIKDFLKGQGFIKFDF